MAKGKEQRANNENQKAKRKKTTSMKQHLIRTGHMQFTAIEWCHRTKVIQAFEHPTASDNSMSSDDPITSDNVMAF